MSCEARTRALLTQIDAREADIGAWAWLDHAHALMQARTLDAGTVQGSLHGLPVGIKDVIDTADMPTEYNSPIYAGHRPPKDAEVVRRLRSVGAILMGKTVTTEFAFMAPGRTRNPHDLRCTPGGSSSGSAAAVAAGMVPVALTTQTGGSTIRPAAFCGVIGYKPAFGRYPTAGLKYLAPSLDTIGLHAQDLNVLARVSAVLAAEAAPVDTGPGTASLRFAVARTHRHAEAEPQALQRLDAIAGAMAAAGAQVRELPWPELLTEIDPLHRVIMASEVARSFAHEWANARDGLSADLRQFIQAGLGYSATQVGVARARVTQARHLLANLLHEDELVLTLAAAGEAPVGLASTGNAAFNRLWTLLGRACLAVPAGRGERGLPLAVQLIGSDDPGSGTERQLLANARWVQDVIAASEFGY